MYVMKLAQIMLKMLANELLMLLVELRIILGLYRNVLTFI